MTDTYGGSPTGPSGPGEYPATFRFDAPEHVANWRPLVHWLLVIPHWIVVYALGIVSEVVAVISWFAILITGNLPEGLANFQALYLRYYLRTLTFLGFLREEYPPFTFATTPADPGDDPRVRVDVLPQLTDRNRLTTAFRIILVIPQIIVVALLGLAVSIVGIVAGFAVLFTGRWPEGLRAFVLGAGRWWLRVQAYWLLLTDEYPPFAFDDLGGTAPQPVSSPPPAPA
jgi:hypothetical protein